MYQSIRPSHIFWHRRYSKKYWTDLLWFFFNARSFWVDNARLFHFLIPSVMSVETDKNRWLQLIVSHNLAICMPLGCKFCFGAMQFNASFYLGNIKTPFKYWSFFCCEWVGTPWNPSVLPILQNAPDISCGAEVVYRCLCLDWSWCGVQESIFRLGFIVKLLRTF